MGNSHSWLLPIPHAVKFSTFCILKGLSLALILNLIHSTPPIQTALKYILVFSHLYLALQYHLHSGFLTKLSAAFLEPETWGFITVFTRYRNFPCPKPNQLNQYRVTLFPWSTYVFKWFILLRFSDQNFLCVSLLSCPCYRLLISSIRSLW